MHIALSQNKVENGKDAKKYIFDYLRPKNFELI